MPAILPAVSLLLTGMLLGAMSLFSFGFAVFVLKTLPTDLARSLIRLAFPPYYLMVILVSAAATLAALPADRFSALVLAAIAITTAIARQVLMPAINAASDRGDRRRFGRLHAVSVLIQIAQILAAGAVLLRL